MSIAGGKNTGLQAESLNKVRGFKWFSKEKVQLFSFFALFSLQRSTAICLSGFHLANRGIEEKVSSDRLIDTFI